jgi:hypothetical protein
LSFTGATKAKEKEHMKTIALCHRLRVWEEREQEEEAKTMTIRNYHCLLFSTRAREATKTTTLCCYFVFEKSKNKEEAKTPIICVIVIVFYFSRMTNDKKKDMKTTIVHYHLLFERSQNKRQRWWWSLWSLSSFGFQRSNNKEEKKGHKKKGSTCRSFSKFILKKTMKTMKKQDMSVVLTSKSCSQAPQIERCKAQHSTTRTLHITP